MFNPPLPPSPPAQLMCTNLVVVLFMIYISTRLEKINKTLGLFHVWLGLYANLLVAFFSFVFVSFGMWAYLDLGIQGLGGLADLFMFLIISIFQCFNFHFGSLKLCFTNLVLEIQDNLSLTFCLH